MSSQNNNEIAIAKQIEALSMFFQGLQRAPSKNAQGEFGPGAIQIVEEIKRTNFRPPQPVGFRTDYYLPPIQNPFSIFWKKLHKLGDKIVLVHRSQRTGKRKLVFLGDRVNAFVELFYKQLLNFIVPFVMLGMLVSGTIYENFFYDDTNPNDSKLLHLIFFFYPNHILLWNLLSVLLTFASVSTFIYSSRGRPQIRSGAIMSLQHLSNVSGFHFMISYNWDSSDLALSLASALAQQPLNVWMDIYRLENAYRLQARISSHLYTSYCFTKSIWVLNFLHLF